MPITSQSSVPYTAGSALIGLIRRYRDKGLAVPLTADVLARAGVSDGLIARTLQALETLDLVDDKGMPTETLKKIRMAPEPDYRACIAEWLKSAYAEVFQFIDPATDDQQAIRDAFRAYNPIGQQGRMVALFLALCAEAGLVDESKKSEPKPAARKPIALRPVGGAPRPPVGIARAGSRNTRTPAPSSGSMPPALAGLMQSLPDSDTGWTAAQRDRFIETFKSVLDFVVPVVTHEPDEEDAP